MMEPFSTYSPKVIRTLFSGKKVSPFLDFSIEGLKKSDAAQAAGRLSVSGVQEKFPAVIDKGVIRLAKDDERSTHILKPAPWDETIAARRHIPANEHLTMQIASQVYGITTADNGLCFSTDGQVVYMNFKYSGCYEDLADGIKKHVVAWMVDMERFLDLVVFNYIYGNGDAHLKNFSLIRSGEDYRLAPAYDLLNTSLHVNGDDFGLDGGLSRHIFMSDIYDKTGHPCRKDFETFGTLIGLRESRVKKLLDRYTVLPDASVTLVGQSLLPEKYKRLYLRIVKERTARFSRLSE